MIPGVMAGFVRESLSIDGRMFGAVNLETYSATLTAEHAVEPVTWTISSGSLPAGLHLSTATTATATIFGVPDDTNGYYSLTLRAEDVNGAVATRAITMGLGSVVSLLHFDGTNGQTTFPDLSSRTWTLTGSGQLSTSSPRFGTASLSLPGTSYIATPHTSNISVDNSAGDFSIRMSAKFTFSNNRVLVQKRYPDPSSGSGTSYGFTLNANAGQLVVSAFNNSSVAPVSFSSTATFNNNTWHDVVLERKASTWLLYVNEAVQGTQVQLSPVLDNANGVLQIANDSLFTGRNFIGNLDEFKFIKGAVIGDGTAFPEAQASDYPQTPAPLAVNGSLPAGATGVAYSSTTDLTIHGSGSPFSVSVSAGALPTGWSASVNGDHVEVAGTTATPGTYTVTLEIEDLAANSAFLPLTVVVTP